MKSLLILLLSCCFYISTAQIITKDQERHAVARNKNLSVQNGSLSRDIVLQQYIEHKQQMLSERFDRSDKKVQPPLPAVQLRTQKSNLLHENANIVTHPGQGPGGSNFSWPYDDNTFGLAMNQAGGYSIVVDVLILDLEWTIDSVRIYGYQTNSGTNSTFTGAYLRVWNGVPGNPGSTVVWGDMTTNILTSTRFTNCYRGLDFNNNQRPIMVNVCATPGLTLTSGQYYFEFATTGSLSSGPWCPPIMAGNDLQLSGGQYTNTGQEMPLDIFGTALQASCPIVTNINATNITDVSLDLSWTENGSATEWEIEYGITGFVPTGTPMLHVTSNPVNITGLNPGTIYDFYVRAYCDSTNQSAWNGPYTTQTLNCPPTNQCIYVFRLYDDFGDGWNNAGIRVIENGLQVAYVTMTGSISDLDVQVPLCNGMNVELVWVSGDYDSECAFTLLTPDEIEIFSFGVGEAPADSSIFHTFTTSCPDCFAPMNIQLTSVTTSSATVQWDTGSGALGWNIEWGPAGFAQGTGTFIPNFPSNTWTVTGLSPATIYDVYLQTICDTSYSAWKKFTFNTLICEPDEQCNYTFELTDTYGDGWNGAEIIIYEQGIRVATITLASGSSAVITQPFCDGSTVELHWVEGTYDEECGLIIRDPDGMVVYNFQAGSSPSAGLFHTFTSQCPVCPAPKNLTASNITLTSAVLSWVPGGSESSWNLEWGPAGFVPGTGTQVNGLTTPQYTLTGLQPATQYAYFVTAFCDSVLSVAAGPYVFSTACLPITTFPWLEGFEGTQFPPNCWQNIDNDGDGFKWESRTNPSQWPTYEGNGVAVSASWTNGQILTPDNWLITPGFVINSPNFTFSLWYAAQDPQYPSDKFSIMISTTDTELTSFSEIFTTIITTNNFNKVTLPLAAYDGQTVYFAIRHWDCTDWFYMKIDNVSVTTTDDVSDIEVSASMRLYPNPATEILYISEPAQVEIYNLRGELVERYENVYKIDVSHLPAGLYTVRTLTDGKFSIHKVNIIR